jgi:hypothetical protein
MKSSSRSGSAPVAADRGRDGQVAAASAFVGSPLAALPRRGVPQTGQ